MLGLRADDIGSDGCGNFSWICLVAHEMRILRWIYTDPDDFNVIELKSFCKINHLIILNRKTKIMKAKK